MSSVNHAFRDLYRDKVYQNEGNPALLALLPKDARRVLDVGCGAGDNAKILHERGCEVVGLTLSEAEAAVARAYCDTVLVANVETDDLELPPGSFDVLLLSHVLEHTVHPTHALTRLAGYLKAGGTALVAVPNMANYRLRLRFLRGDWRRDDGGAMDRTHLHFWSYHTIDEAFRGTPLHIVAKVPGDPAVPLWPLRRLLPHAVLRGPDHWGGRLWPNLLLDKSSSWPAGPRTSRSRRPAHCPMKILHVIPGLTYERGGPSTVVCALARHQADAGHDVAVVYTDQGTRSGEKPIALPTGVSSGWTRVVGPDRLAFSPRFAGLVREHLRNCDIVHVHSIFTHPVHVALRESLRAGVPIVLRPCGHLHRFSLRRTRWLKKCYLGVWGPLVQRAVSCWHYTSAREAAESWPGEARPHFILANGVEPDDYSMSRTEAQAAVARNWPEIGNSPYVLFLARLHPKKRLDLLLESFLAGAPPECKLVVAGPDECGLWTALARRYLRQADPARRVVRLGTVSGCDKVALLAGARLFALPSEHENFGNAALEALSAGTPALLSPHVDLAGPGMEEHLHRAPLDVHVWAQHLRRLLTDASFVAAAQGASREVCERYSWQHVARDLIERYHWVRAGCRGAVSLGAAGS